MKIHKPGTALFLICLAALTTAGCNESARTTREQDSNTHSASWTQYGIDRNNSDNTPNETTLDADNVSKLREQWRLRVPGGATGTPLILDGTAYFGAWNGHFYAVDARSGEIRWDRQLTSLMIRSTPLLSADRVYVGAGRACSRSIARQAIRYSRAR